MVMVSLYNLVNTFWVAKLGYQAVAALTSVFPFFILCMALGAGTGVGVNALTSRLFGEKNIEEANRSAGQTFFLVIVLGIVFVLGANLFTDQILNLCGTPLDVLEPARVYLKILGFATPLLFFSLASRNIYHASGDTVRPMIFNIIGQIINIILDPFLIFGWFGLVEPMGVGGAALATVISSGISGLLSLGYLLSGKTAYHFRWHHILPRFDIIKNIYRVGGPSIIMEALESVIFAFFNHIAASFGSIVLAAIGIAGRISDLAFMPVIGTSHGLLPIIGFSLGKTLESCQICLSRNS
jgi:putative MATE family efflux protein